MRTQGYSNKKNICVFVNTLYYGEIMRLHNTRTRAIEQVTPLQDNTVRVYSCGPTVYDHAHIGNLSAYIFADMLHRTLAASGYQVTHVMNYTDVDDKTIRKSREKFPELQPRDSLQKLADYYIDIFNADMQAVGNDLAGLQFIRATDPKVITGMQQLISQLHDKGFAYVADDGIYFSIEAYKKSGKTYGQLTEITAQNTSAARIQNDEYDKESVHDFALWKKQKQGEPAWPFTLAGQDITGRPGWHIECSVMSRLLLGQPFDIHTGGVDLIFPHHENEIAQSTALEENPVMATFFAHNEHILVDGKKMAKSAGNFFTLEDITKKGFDPLAFRLLVLQAHYRSQVNFTWESLEAAQNRLKNIRAFADLRFQPITSGNYELDELDYTEYGNIIQNQLQNDLDTPNALAQLSLVVDGRQSSVHQDELDEHRAFLELLDSALGLQLLTSTDITDEQKTLVAGREQARQAKDWAKSDELRNKLTAQGIGLRDTLHGSIWYRL